MDHRVALLGWPAHWAVPTLEYKFHPTRKWRFDYSVVNRKVAIELEGAVWAYGRHNRPAGFLKDMEKYDTATAMGWRVLRFPTGKTIPLSEVDWDMVQEAIKHNKENWE